MENNAGYGAVTCHSRPCGRDVPHEKCFWYFGVVQKNLGSLFTTSVQNFFSLKKVGVL